MYENLSNTTNFVSTVILYKIKYLLRYYFDKFYGETYMLEVMKYKYKDYIAFYPYSTFHRACIARRIVKSATALSTKLPIFYYIAIIPTHTE